MINLLNKKIGSRIAHNLGLGAKEGQRFTRQATQSSIGGEGVGFSKMSLEDQNRFINEYNAQYNAPKNKSIPERLVSQEREALSPQQKMERYESQRVRRDEGLEPTVRRERQEEAQRLNAEKEARRKRLEEQQRKTDRTNKGENIEGYYEPARPPAPRKVTGASHQVGDANQYSALDPALKDPNKPRPPIVEQAASAEPGTPNILQRTFNAIAGDTSGAASAAAGRTFQESYESVFSSKETAEAFGIDQNVLKTAFGQSGDDFKATLQGAGASDSVIEGLDAFRNQVKLVQDEGGQLSEEGMQAMLRNQGELGNMYGGFSRASASASPNAILRGLGGEGTGGEAFLGIMGAAALAGGANTMMGGDFFEGAAVGGGAAFGMRALAKGVAGSMGDIEQSMMKSILGDDMATPGSKTVTEIIERDIKSGTRLSEIPEQYTGSVKMGEVNPHLMDYDNNAANMSIKEYLEADATRGNVVTSENAVARQSRQFEMENVSTSQARRMNLETIKGMAADDERLKGFGKKRMQKLLDPTKSKNTAVNNRALVLGGSMLSGVAFTGSADKRDYRRGFNAHRGNRI